MKFIFILLLLLIPVPKAFGAWHLYLIPSIGKAENRERPKYIMPDADQPQVVPAAWRWFGFQGLLLVAADTPDAVL